MARHFPHRKAAFILPLVFCLAACSHSPAESSKDSVSQSSQSVMTISCQAEASSEQSADPENRPAWMSSRKWIRSGKYRRKA